MNSQATTACRPEAQYPSKHDRVCVSTDPETCSNLAAQNFARLSSLLDQIVSIRSAVAPGGTGENNDPKPQRSGLQGTLLDTAELIGQVENVVGALGKQI